MVKASNQSAAASGDHWTAAKRYSQKLGYIPGSFASAVRTLTNDHFENNAELRPVTKYNIARLFRTPSFTAMLYFASKDLRGGYISSGERLTVGRMMDFFEPLDLAALIAIFVYYRKSRKLLDGQGEWQYLREVLVPEALLGGRVGVAAPSLGVGAGLLLGTMRHFGLAAMAVAELGGYRNYRRELKKQGKREDAQLESQLWGCKALETSVFLISNIGLGVDIGEAVIVGFDESRNLRHMENKLHRKMRAGRIWIDCLLAGGEQPEGAVPAEFFPVPGELKSLYEDAQKIREGKIPWLEKSKADLTPEKAPELFAKPVAPEGDFEVPEQLADVFSLDEITKMEEEDFDTLVDQIDLEQEGKDPTTEASLKRSDLDQLESIVDD